ncbi:MAG: hypothetical protein DCF25_05860 [Leptolyngbya foveolarum]|uniref:MobA/MobL protein domain-containing protein n=1 Tax=Leptolyngbya foveolarum TaxID=47253 RepID=A0A2W4WNJ0_9CYAN|nr:MAG: hypothetical protein DCF25_05860 [Leptolyngbya foveolarum]
MQVIGRSAGRSATAAAAYRSGEEVRDERTGKVHDYTGKSDIYGSEILLPVGAPERLSDRVTLWNAVERVEKRKDAQLSREVMIALPAELSHSQKETLAREYVQAEFVSQGMIADIGYHDFDSHNPHAHIMLTMRNVDEDGFGKKRREWNKRQAIERHRQAWEEYANRALERAGFEERIDHRSLEAQGIEREPQIHLGAKVMEIESRGVQTRVGDESRRISAANYDIDQQAAIREKLLAVTARDQGIPEAPKLIFSNESGSELNQVLPTPIIESSPAPISQPVKPSAVPSIEPELVRRFGEALVRRRDEMILENSPVVGELSAVIGKITAMMNELSAAAAEVAGKIDEVLAKGGKEQAATDAKLRQPQQLEGGQAMQSDGVAEVILRHIDPRDLARHQAQIAEAKKTAPSVEKEQEPVNRQEPSKQRQQKQAKKRDQGMEL